MPQQEDLPASSHGGQRVCKYAAIGINYNGQFVAFCAH